MASFEQCIVPWQRWKTYSDSELWRLLKSHRYFVEATTDVQRLRLSRLVICQIADELAGGRRKCVMHKQGGCGYREGSGYRHPDMHFLDFHHKTGPVLYYVSSYKHSMDGNFRRNTIEAHQREAAKCELRCELHHDALHTSAREAARAPCRIKSAAGD